MLASEKVRNEYRQHILRGGRDYSVVHQVLYLAPIMLIAGKPHSILDVGFGIGFGLRHMLEANCLGRYVGYDPCTESYEFVRNTFGGDSRITLINERFRGTDASYDYTFCIETIDEIQDEEARIDFLQQVSLATYKTLFLSSPDRSRNDRGVYTEHEMVRRLYKAGFDNVIPVTEQWTNLYICS